MDVQKLEALPPPPNVFGSLKAGFDIVSTRVALILIPLGLDLLLWFGPRLSVNNLLAPYYTYVFEQGIKSVADTDISQFVQSRALIMDQLEKFNLLNLLSKLQLFPIGIVSLAARTLPNDTPLGAQTVVGISSFWILLGLAAILIPMGWIFGGLYFRQVAASILGEQEAGVGPVRAVAQTLLLSILWAVVLAIILVPLLLIFTVLALISSVLANIVLLIFMFLSFWLIVPIFFTPHGIFVRGQNALYSFYSSLRMTRFSLPTSGMFVLSVFLLSRGLDILWSVPESNSWLALVGFAGHAFITTALLAGSFVYYRDMTNWLQNVYEKIQQIRNKPSSTA